MSVFHLCILQWQDVGCSISHHTTVCCGHHHGGGFSPALLLVWCGYRVEKVPNCKWYNDECVDIVKSLLLYPSQRSWVGSLCPSACLSVDQGPDSILLCRLTSIGNSIVEIRRSYDRLISTMGFPILVRKHLYIESGPRSCPVYIFHNTSQIYFKFTHLIDQL